VAETPTSSGHKTAIVIGAGFGGIRAARGLAKVDGVDVVVIDSNNFHTFQPLLYQVATAGLDADDVCFPVRGILRKDRSTTFVLGTVSGIDLTSQQVALEDGRMYTYDYLVIAAGSISADFGVPGVNEHTFPLKTLQDALALRTHFLTRFEDATAHLNGDIDLGIVVVGGGPTGVEMAGGLRELIDHVIAKDFPDLGASRTQITLVEAADRVLGPFHPKLSAQAEQALTRRGIRVETTSAVDHVTADAVVLKDGRKLAAGTIIWATGVTANPVAKLLGVPLGRGGRIPVEANLSLPKHRNVFAIGDIALSPTSDDRPLPQVAQPAIQGGKHVATQISHLIAGRSTTPFTYRDKGSMATIGRNQAVTEFPNGLRFHGFIGWLMWLGLHIVYLMGFRNRANVLVNWAWNYLTYDRGSRIIVK
jgi:NADH:ubiquinone reductase (H+-translocating)